MSRPTASAQRTIRSATISGCSIRLVEWVTTPGMSTLPSGSLTSFHSFHSCSWRTLAASKEYPFGVDRQHQVQQVLHRDVGGMRAVPAPPAEVEADLVGGQPADRVVEHVDAFLRIAPVALDARLLLLLIPVLADRRVVELDDQPGVDDRLVLLAHRVRAGVHQLLFGLVVLVRHARAARRRDRVHPAAFLDSRRREPGLEVGDVALESRPGPCS